ncbi:hypothetical protein [Psychromonas sp. B3M02]|uniref:hypothetical protein n=1 Tax=Psychromonas sp. B3M02 TaxID=2267226 RepID=UPI0015F051E2|nr:hypothetical protein [Psychromonas sp. B3M02]
MIKYLTKAAIILTGNSEQLIDGVATGVSYGEEGSKPMTILEILLRSHKKGTEVP